MTFWVIINALRVFLKKGVPRLIKHDDVTGPPMVKIVRGPACLKSGPGYRSSTACLLHGIIFRGVAGIRDDWIVDFYYPILFCF